MKTIVTHGSPSYLIWRYIKVPVTSYLAIGEEAGGELKGLILGRIKLTRWGREMRITDFFWTGEGNGKELMLKLKEIKKMLRIDYATLSGTVASQSLNLFSSFNFNVTIGPIVTLRPLQYTRLDSFTNFSNWSPSLGDLELF
jgi:hypothetical protein